MSKRGKAPLANSFPLLWQRRGKQGEDCINPEGGLPAAALTQAGRAGIDNNRWGEGRKIKDQATDTARADMEKPPYPPVFAEAATRRQAFSKGDKIYLSSTNSPQQDFLTKVSTKIYNVTRTSYRYYLYRDNIVSTLTPCQIYGGGLMSFVNP